MKKKNAFTLIELIAVLVIMAVVAIVVAPLILDTIKKAKYSVNMRSIDGYGRAVELSMASYQLENLTYPDSFDELDIEYNGNKVECDTSRINPDHTIYLSKCKVNGKYVKSDKNKDGYYHYGILKLTNIEYVDTYGKNIEKALNEYYDEHGEYPNDYTTLVIEELDKDISCDIEIYDNGKIYMTKCSVNNIEIIDESKKDNYYHYGNKQYKIGDIVQYNNMDFYVIDDSDDSVNGVTMLKSEPLSTSEVNQYGAGHINNYSNGSVGTAYNRNGYGGITYYNRADCGFVDGGFISVGCTNNWNSSDIKYVLDNWSNEKILNDDLEEDSLGYNIRLLTVDELKNNLGYGSSNQPNPNIPSWVYNNKYWYWIMPTTISSQTYYINPNGEYSNYNGNNVGYYNDGVIRPVLTFKKSALE